MAQAKTIRVERAPTQFGEVSFEIHSVISKGYVDADVTLPPRAPAKTLLRLRLPGNFDTKSIDLTGRVGRVHVREACKPS